MASATCCASAVRVTSMAPPARRHLAVHQAGAAATTSARVGVSSPMTSRPRGVRSQAVAEAAVDAAPSLADSLRPSSADCARTLVAIANTGTISTTCEDGFALGTFASYVVTKKEGEIVLRMRGDAMHTANIERDARCSLYVQPSTQPPGVMSRATLIGSLERLDDDAAAAAAAQYNAVHGENVGVDAAGAADNYYKFAVDRVFYVGGLGSDKRAEVVSADDFASAVVDPLSDCALEVVDAMNNERYEDVINFARSSLPEEEPAEARMLWVDTLGFDVRVITTSGAVLDVRLPFTAPATNQNEAVSRLTIMAQILWEEEKQYQPVPIPREEPKAE